MAAGLNKKLIYHANLNMEVENYEKAQTEVRNWVNLARGYIIGFTETVSDSEHGGTFVVKVPATGFSSFMDNLEKVKHESLQRSIEGQDVSEEYVDLEARLKAKQLLETQYIEFMKRLSKPQIWWLLPMSLAKFRRRSSRSRAECAISTRMCCTPRWNFGSTRRT